MADDIPVVDAVAKVGKDPLNPDDIGMQSARFEASLSSFFAPLIGLNVFLLGSLTLVELLPETVWGVTLLAAILGGGVALWIAREPREKQLGLGAFAGAGFALLALALLALPVGTWFTDALAIVLSYVLGWLIVKQRLGPRTAIMLIIYLPLMLFYLRPDSAGERLAVEAASFIPLFLLFHFNAQRIASLTVLVGGIFTASLELYQQEQAMWALILLLGTLVIFAIFYEWRLKREVKSNTRIFFGQSVFMLLLFLFLKSLSLESGLLTLWLWAGLGSTYQIFKTFQDKLQEPTRLAWAVIAVFLALIQDDELLAWPAQAALVLGMVALTQMVALTSNNRFLANIGIALTIVLALIVNQHSHEGFWLVTLLLGLAISAVFLLQSRLPAMPVSTSWWVGFLKEEHAAWLSNLFSSILGFITNIGFVGAILRFLGRIFRWMKYFKGGGQSVGMNDLLFAVANFYGANIVSEQLALLAHNQYWLLDTLLLASAWCVWGIALFIYGLRQEQLLYRLLALVMIITPAFFELRSQAVPEDAVISLLAMICGSSLWLAGICARQLKRAEADTPAAG